VPSTTGFAVQARVGPAELARADTVVVPGYAPYDAPSPAVLAALRRATGRGARMVSVCTGAFALAAAGLLDGRRATTHWRDAAELAARHPAVHVDADVLFVDDGAVLTSAGVAAGIDLRLHLVRGDYGEQAASRIARRMVVAPYRDGGQAQFVQRPLPVNGTGLAATCAWARERLAEPVTRRRPRRAAAAGGEAAAGSHPAASRSGRGSLRARHHRQPPAASAAGRGHHPHGLPAQLPGSRRSRCRRYAGSRAGGPVRNYAALASAAGSAGRSSLRARTSTATAMAAAASSAAPTAKAT